MKLLQFFVERAVTHEKTIRRTRPGGSPHFPSSLTLSQHLRGRVYTEISFYRVVLRREGALGCFHASNYSTATGSIEIYSFPHSNLHFFTINS